MHLSTNCLSDVEQQFLRELLTPDAVGPNREAEAIFATIQKCFEGLPKGAVVAVNANLLCHLAICTRIALAHPAGVWIHWGSAEYDFVVLDLLRALVKTLETMLRQNDVRVVGERVYCGSFCIPTWFINHVRQRAAA